MPHVATRADTKGRQQPAKKKAKPPSPDCDICLGEGTFKDTLFHPCGEPMLRDGEPWEVRLPCPRCRPAEARKQGLTIDLAPKADVIATAMPGDIGPMLPDAAAAAQPAKKLRARPKLEPAELFERCLFQMTVAIETMLDAREGDAAYRRLVFEMVRERLAEIEAEATERAIAEHTDGLGIPPFLRRAAP
jgi:hypothetical protein